MSKKPQRVLTPGIYNGLDGNELGKKCVNSVVDDLRIYMSNFQPMKIIEEAYLALEETIFMMFTPMGKIHLLNKYGVKTTDSIELEETTTLLSENSRFMAEAALFYGGTSGIPSAENIQDIAQLTNFIVKLALNLDLFYFSSQKFPNFELELTKSGELLLKHDPELVDLRTRIVEKFAQEKERDTFILPLSAVERSRVRNKLYDKYASVDSPYEAIHGYKFTDALRFLFAITKLLKNKKFGTSGFIPRKKLTKKLRDITNFPQEKVSMIFADFEITRDGLRNEGFPNWKLKRRFSLAWRPIITVSMGGHNPVSVVGKQTSIGDMSMLVTSLEGFLNLGEPTEELRHKKAKEFERDVATIMESHGFLTIKNIASPKGEIDIIGIYRDLVLVVECKAPTFKIDPSELLQDLKDMEGWGKKLEGKITWVRERTEQIFEQICGKKADVSSLLVNGIIVTQRPFYDKLFENCEIVFWHDLPAWLSRLHWR